MIPLIRVDFSTLEFAWRLGLMPLWKWPTERASGHLVFLELSVVENVLELGERNDKGVAKLKHVV